VPAVAKHNTLAHLWVDHRQHSGNIQSTLGNIQSTLGNIQSTLGNIQSTLGNIQSTLVRCIAPCCPSPLQTCARHC
jgi:DNA anti-recombination protein RmuC